MKAVVAAFNQEKALVGAFYVITNLRMELLEALVASGGSIPAVKSWLIITSPSPASKHLNTDIPVSRSSQPVTARLQLQLMTLLSAPTVTLIVANRNI